MELMEKLEKLVLRKEPKKENQVEVQAFLKSVGNVTIFDPKTVSKKVYAIA